jgi:uncharacterized membrane protein
VTRQQAATVVAAPLDVVEERLADVGRWPEFLSGLAAVAPAGFERYRFTISAGKQQRVVPVCVVPHAAEHRISWRALEGPRYLGELRLHAVDDRHTKIELTMTADPTGLMDGLREIVGERHQTAALDLQRLDAFVTARQPSD